jgi:hypothetical protein
MARTFLRQDTQVRGSDVYDDTVVPAEATYETNPTNIEENLNHLRSQVSNLFDGRAGDWFIDLNTPSALESGSQRGVNDLNTGLHALEKKRVLRPVKLLSDVTVTASVAATETLTSAGAFSDTETVTIGSRTYAFRTPFADVADAIDASGTVAQTHENLRRAINGDGVAGTNYGTGTAVNTEVSAADAATSNVLTSLAGGTQGNALVSTTTGANLSFGGATFSGGAGGDIEVLAAGELPSQTTAAVGAVTTLGTVVASAASFLTAGLDEVAGLHALAPHNLVEILDGNSGDPFLTTGSGTSPAGKRIWGLLQGESGLTDGTTITDATTTRVQITFVIANATNDDLILVDGAEMGGKIINYCYRERVRLEDLNEGDFLNSAAIDIGAGAVTPTRQVSYDNQGVTIVTQTTNATLDLATGTTWEIGDLASASLFAITEGSGGGTSDVAIGSDVDTFDVDAADNDFLNGVSVDTGAAGTTINLGVTANQIDSGGALTVTSGGAGDATYTSAAETYLDDANRSGSTWGTGGILLTDTQAEWDALEVCYPGEPSLAVMLCTALNTANFAKTCANVTSAVTANNNVSNSDGNLDAALGDLSGGTFITDHDIYLNGQLLRSGVDLNADHDVYPGTDLDNTADAQLKFEFVVKNNDVICVISRA